MVRVCGACTFENSDARTVCEVCQTPLPPPEKPKPAPPATRQPSQPVRATAAASSKWACGVCTFENEGSATSCAVCGSPRTEAPAAQPVQQPAPAARQAPAAQAKPAATSYSAVQVPINSSTTSAPQAAATSQRAAPTTQRMPVGIASGLPQQLNNQMQIDDAISYSSQQRQPQSSSNSLSSASTSQQQNPATSLRPGQYELPSFVPSVTPRGAFQPAQPPQFSQPMQTTLSSSSSSATAGQQPVAAPTTTIIDTTPTPEQVEAKKRELAEVRQQIEQQKRAEAEKQLRKSVEKERQEQAERDAARHQRQQLRAQQEAHLKSVDDAVATLTKEQEPTRLHQILNLLIRIIRNILKDPKNEKYRTIRLGSPAVNRLIDRPLGASYILRAVGFERLPHSPHEPPPKLIVGDLRESQPNHEVMYLQPNKVNVNQLRQALDYLQSLVKQQETPVAATFQHLESQPSYAVDQLYYAAVELRNTFDNVLASPDDLDYKRIDIESQTYRQRFKPIPEILTLLQQFNFVKPKPESPFLMFQGDDLRQLDAGVVDLNKVIQRLRPQTTLYQTIQHIVTANKHQIPAIHTVVNAFLEAVRTIIQYPFEDKYQKINLKKFASKYGRLKGLARLFEHFNFTVDKTTDTATINAKVVEKDSDRLRLKCIEVEELVKASIGTADDSTAFG